MPRIRSTRRMRFRFPSPIYPIVDPLGVSERSPLQIASELVHAGASILQLRAKGLAAGELIEQACRIREITRAASTLMILNDRADIAKLVDADGVHLGQQDLPLEAARAIVGPSKILGWSTHNLTQANQAEKEGIADYIGYGPIFPTSSKDNPDPVQGLSGLAEVRQVVTLPIVAIGGITLENASSVLAAGADAVAMIGTITHARDIGYTMRTLLAL